MKKKEKVNHPKHYNPGTYETIKIIEAYGLGKGFCLGNILKYVLRAGRKENELEDLKKARWYIGRRIKQLEEKK